MFFITVFEAIEHYERIGCYGLKSQRTWGYFDTFEKANDVVINNITDINETIYDYAVIEEIPAGIAPEPLSKHYYKFNYEKGKYYSIDPPEELKRSDNVYSYVIG